MRGATLSDITGDMMCSDLTSNAPTGIQGWLRAFDLQSLPVLGETVEALAVLSANEDAVDARLLADAIAGDPLMTVKVLAHAGALGRRDATRLGGEVETVTAAVLMMGIGPFFREFRGVVSAEAILETHPGALEGFRAVLRRCQRATNFAGVMAIHRLDHDVAVIQDAALLHCLTELLLWLRAPSVAAAIATAQAEDRELRSSAAQRRFLGLELRDVLQALLSAWGLPKLLVRLDDECHAHDPQVRCVLLGIRLARHTASGWENPAVPDDLREAARLLNIAPAHARSLLQQADS